MSRIPDPERAHFAIRIDEEGRVTVLDIAPPPTLLGSLRRHDPRLDRPPNEWRFG
jgi:hypothetical protein